jgi:hypothetical protein
MNSISIAEIPSPDPGRGHRGRFKIIAGILLALLPVTAGLAVLVLHVMGPAAAGVTGGCGGG